MSILVTGGAGFIGSNFVIDWVNKRKELIINLDKLTYSGNLENLESIKDNPNHIFVHGDISDTQLLRQLLSEYQPRAVINMAAETHVDRSIMTPELFLQTNLLGTFFLLESVREYWDELNGKEKKNFRFLHISTDEVYGSLSYDAPAFTENNRYEPNSPYSATKASSDHLVRAYYETYAIPTLTTNCSNNYGPFQYPEKLIPLVIKNALLSHDIPIYGDGLNVRDWLYVKDHCRAIRRVLEEGRMGEVYNIGGSNEKTNLEVVQELCKIMDELKPRKDNSSYNSLITFVEDRAGHDLRYAIDSSKITKDLNWAPSETFETGIIKTVQWYLSK